VRREAGKHTQSRQSHTSLGQAWPIDATSPLLLSPLPQIQDSRVGGKTATRPARITGQKGRPRQPDWAGEGWASTLSRPESVGGWVPLTLINTTARHHTSHQRLTAATTVLNELSDVAPAAATVAPHAAPLQLCENGRFEPRSARPPRAFDGLAPIRSQWRLARGSDGSTPS